MIRNRKQGIYKEVVQLYQIIIQAKISYQSLLMDGMAILYVGPTLSQSNYRGGINNCIKINLQIVYDIIALPCYGTCYFNRQRWSSKSPTTLSET